MWDVLLDIPLWLHGAIIRDWLTTKDMVLLDWAYCDEHARNLLWQAFKRVNAVLKPNPWRTDPSADSFARWVTKRGVPVGQVAIASLLSVFPAFSLMQNIETSLTATKLKTSPVIVALVGTVCCCIRHAELFDCTDFEAVGVFLNGIHTTVERLVLVSCKLQSGAELCTMSFPKLTGLITKRFRVEEWFESVAMGSPLLRCLNIVSLTSPKYELPHPLNGAGNFSLPSLEVLSLTEFDHFSAPAVSAMIDTRLLCALTVQRSCFFGDYMLQEIARSVPRLRRFHIGSCSDVNATGVAHFLRQCTQLIGFGVYRMSFDLCDHAFLDALRALRCEVSMLVVIHWARKSFGR
jgi:hypothetical protein